MKKLFASFALSLMLLLAMPVAAEAWSPFHDIHCGGPAKSSAVCQDKKKTGNPVSGNGSLLLKITNLITIIAGVAAIIVIVVAGLKFVQSSGSSDDVTSARRTLIYAIVGLIVIVLARTLISLILSKL